MVALAGIAAAGEVLQVLRPVEVVLPGADVADGDVGVAAQEGGSLLLRHHGDDGGGAPVHAVRLDGGEGGVLIPLRAGDGVVIDLLAVDVVADEEAAGGLRPGGVQVAPPHELRQGGVLAEAVGTALIVSVQGREVLPAHAFPLQHTVILFLLVMIGAGPQGGNVSL